MNTPANRRILLIDDTPAIHEDFRKILAPAAASSALDEEAAALFGHGAQPASAIGFELDSAYQGQEGVAMVRTALDNGAPYAVALVDMRMPPGLDGIETIERIWRQDPLIQVVICTAYSDYDWAELLARLDVGDRLLILKKPFDPIEVRQVACALTVKWEMTRQAALKMAELEAANRQLAEANRELRAREARIRSLVEANIIGIFFWDLDGSIGEANDAFLAMLGYRREDATKGALRWDRLTPPEYVAADRRAVEEVARTGRCQPFEKQFLHRDGHRVPVLVGGTLLEGSQSQGVAFVLDLSERKQAEADRQARLAAEAASRAKSDFLSAMSHELRTPLNAILGYAQMLKRDPGLDERQAGGVSTIEQSGQHLLALINDLLDLAKIEAGKFDLDLDAINPAALLPVVADIIRIKAEEKNLHFSCTAGGELPQGVLADEKRLRQVLLNLLANAVKFTDRGRVSLEVHVLELDAATVRLRFQVADTGIGLAPDQIERIFQAFEQVGDAHRRAGGTGLGLAISRRLVRLMGSDIEVDSRPGAGSRFWFDLVLPIVALFASADQAECDAAIPLAFPPRSEMAVLHQQALTGNMRAIRQQADHLIELDEAYRPFAQLLQRLAQGYQSKALLSLIEVHLRGETR